MKKPQATLFLGDFVKPSQSNNFNKPPISNNNDAYNNNNNSNIDASNICSFFAQGKICKYGEKCKFSHTNPFPTPSTSVPQSLNISNLLLGKERGKIIEINETKNYGFISPYSGGKQIFFHGRDAEGPLAVNDEVEYSLTNDKFKNGELKAVEIKLLPKLVIPKNSQKQEEDNFQLFVPSWMKKDNNSANNNNNHLNNEDKPNIHKNGGSSYKKRKNEELKNETEFLTWHRGIVKTVKSELFGFIQYNGKDLVFYHVNEVEDNKQFEEGDEVEFYLMPDTRKNGKELKATHVRLVSLPNHLPSSMFDSKAENEKYKSLFQDKHNVFDWIEKMNEKNGSMLLLHLEELEAILNREEIPFPMIYSLLELLTSHFIQTSERTTPIYNIVLQSKFFRNPRNLKAYLSKISEHKQRNAQEVQFEFLPVVNLIQQIMERLNPPPVDLPLDTLQSCVEKIKSNLSPQIIQSVNKMLKIRNYRKSEVAEQFKAKQWSPKGEEEDFRNISIFPNPEEILSVEKGKLSSKIRPNIINGKYQNVMHYLDTHFRLLREDCIQPLREGIRSFKENKNSRDIRVYKEVVMCGIQCGRAGIVYRISFQLDRPPLSWESSKRLIYGSLLCLSSDGFETLLWATVVNRDPFLLPSSQQIDIRFPSGFESNFVPGKIYTMVESSTTYFEAYQHVLRGLQELDIHNFPFVDYLISCQPNVKHPSYLTSRDSYDFSSVFEDGKLKFPILQPWPLDQIQSTLDSSQMAALENALTKELSIIQGPPGTGKTFVGLKVVKALLENDHCRKPSPILVICYTNHALDQFLEGILQFEDRLVRIGSRSKSEALKEKNLRSLMFETGRIGKQHQKARYEINFQLEQLQSQIDLCIKDLNQKTLTLEQLKQVITPEQYSSLTSGRKIKKREVKDIINFWLSGIMIKNSKEESNSKENEEEKIVDLPKKSIPGDEVVKKKKKSKKKNKTFKVEEPTMDSKKPESNVNQSEISTNSQLNVEKKQSQKKKEKHANSNQPPSTEFKENQDQPTTQIKSNEVIEEELELDDEIILQMQLERMTGEDETLQQEGILELNEGIIMGFAEVELSPELIKQKNVWELDRNQRHELFSYWISKYHNIDLQKNDLPLLCEKYDSLCGQKKSLEEEIQIEILNNSRIIGMTTTGVAKFQKLIHAVQPEIIIVEEAAEVLEAHIIVALSPSTKHLILIGDHEQLRPSTAVYELSTRFHLDVSLFERLVKNGIEQKTLLKQRRMRPSISALISPIYPKLQDHAYVITYPEVKGVMGNIFFLDHSSPEIHNEETLSRSNPFEAEFIARFCNYLLLQTYEPNQITVLSAYSGQVQLLRKEFRKLNLTRVRITSVDNFQGEEADIIILSLVRSNSAGEMGFLKTSNRICVALSRAKIGFYCIGNSKVLETNSLWSSVIELFKKENAFGYFMRMQCQNHPETFTDVITAQDFDKIQDGGCHRSCGQTMECGHVCSKFCHVIPHSQISCLKPCNRIRKDCNHPCYKHCFEDCGPCEVIVNKTLPCGHKNQLPCYLPEEDFTCLQPCKRMLSCGRHKCPKICGMVCPSSCTEIIERKIPGCNHSINIECGTDLSAYIYKCTQPCNQQLPCTHSCQGNCFTCKGGKQHIICVQCQ